MTARLSALLAPALVALAALGVGAAVAAQPDVSGSPASELGAATSQASAAVASESEADADAQLQSQVPALGEPEGLVRNVVVAQFAAPESSRARAGVLQVLADHPEVDVVSIDDVGFAALRLQADPATQVGRAKLSRELGIDAWMDGRVEGETAHLTLSGGDGTLLQELTVEADSAKLLDTLAGERMWEKMGTRLSAHEKQRRALLATYDIARAKYEARAAASERQTALAREREQRRAAILQAQAGLAQRKRAALLAEVARQGGLASARLPAPEVVQPQPEMPQVTKGTQVGGDRNAPAAKRSKAAARRERKREAAAKRARRKRGVAAPGLTNTGDMTSQKQADIRRRARPGDGHGGGRGPGGAAEGGDGSPRELLSRQ